MFSCVIVAVIQFCFFLNRRDITASFEGRTAETAREMLERHEWILPYCNGAPRLAKPPLAYWACDLAWSIAGKIDVWTARLPAALCGAIGVLLIIDLTRRTIGRTAAICAGLAWISTFFIVDEFRKAMTDPYLAFFTIAAVWAWVCAEQGEGWQAVACVFVSYIFAALAALAKGHVVLL